MHVPILPILILNARPAAGKSEVIEYLKHIPSTERQQRFHLNRLEVIDDFPILWSWFEEDAILENMGFPRLHTDPKGYFLGHHLWHVLIKRLCQEYAKKIRDMEDYHETRTTVIEFSRGMEHGGYAAAYENLSRKVLESAAILYIQTSWEESLRKNRARYNPDRPDSILEHGLDDEKMFNLYHDDDWLSLTKDSHYLTIQGLKVPYAIFPNEDDLTSSKKPALGTRLEKTLNTLWDAYYQRPQFR